MNIFSRIKMALSPRFDELIRQYMAGDDIKIGSTTVTESTAMRFSVVFACFRVLAETFASVPVFEYQKTEDGDREQTDDTGIFDILHGAANDEMSSYNWKESTMYQMCAGGNAVSVRMLDKVGRLIGLYPIQWQRVRINREENGTLFYEVDHKKKYRRDEIFHLPGPSMGGVVGMSIIEYAASAIQLGATYEKFGLKFYEKGAIPSIILEHPTHFSPEAAKRFKDDFKKNKQGLDNSGDPLVLEDGMKASHLTMKLSDAELLSSKKFQVEDFCRFCRVPLHLVQSLDHATNNNIEHQSLEFAMYTMLPHFKRAEDCINTQLLSREQRRKGYYFEFNMNALLRGDAKSMADAFAVGRQWGWLSVNDIRRMLNLNRIPNGGVYLQPMNMIEAGKEIPPTPEIVDPKIKEEIENLLNRARI